MLFVVVIVLGSSQRESRASAQVVTASQISQDTTDARVFAVLFRRVNSFETLAKAAPSPDMPEAHLNAVLPTHFKLNDFDTANLLRVAASWQQQVAPIQLQLATLMSDYRDALASGPLIPGQTTAPPPEKKVLQAKIDAVTLQQRDALQNMMNNTDFQPLAIEVRGMFAGNQLLPPSPSAAPVTGPAVKQ